MWSHAQFRLSAALVVVFTIFFVYHNPRARHIFGLTTPTVPAVDFSDDVPPHMNEPPGPASTVAPVWGTFDGKEHPNGVPRKFTSGGKAQRYPGNTIQSRLDPDSPLYTSLLTLHAKLQASPQASQGLYVTLPPESWHVTVFEGATEQNRKPGYWPAGAGAEATMKECNDFFKQKLQGFNLAADAGPPYHMLVRDFYEPIHTIAVRVEGNTAEEVTRLRVLRDRLSETLGIKQKNHQQYEFQVTVAYLLRWLNPEQKAELSDMLWEHKLRMPTEFDMGRLEFAVFEDMFGYESVFYLGETDENSGHHEEKREMLG
jgi:hypothetical protein